MYKIALTMYYGIFPISNLNFNIGIIHLIYLRHVKPSQPPRWLLSLHQQFQATGLDFNFEPPYISNGRLVFLCFIRRDWTNNIRLCTPIT